MNSSILFLVDHKHRDLPALSLIGYFLKQKYNIEAHFAPLNEENEVIDRSNPGFIVIPKANYDVGQLLKFRKSGRRIVVLDTEGNPQQKNYKVRIMVQPDLYLFWNESYMGRYVDEFRKARVQHAALGCYRTDFLSDELKTLLPSKKQVLSKLGLDHQTQTITLATASQEAHHSSKRWAAKEKRRKRSMKSGADYSVIVQNSLRLRQVNEEIIRSFVGNPSANLVVKPHPNENVVYWHDFLASLNSPNIKLMTREPISTLLSISDLHISNNCCTTTAEAAIFGLPTVEVHTEFTSKQYDSAHSSVAHHIIHSADELKAIVASYHDKTDVMLSGTQADYLYTHYGKTDGRRCEAYAEYLAQYIQDCRSGGEPVGGLTVSNRALALILKFWRLLNTRKRKAAQIASMRTNHPEAAPEDAVIEINGVKTSKEYGLIDNRMRIGDEAAWNIKFDEIGVGVARNSVRADGSD